MTLEKQKTIARDISCEGIGLHTGGKVKMTFKPAEPGTGICFIRTDLAERPSIKATVDNVVLYSGSARRSCLGTDGVQVTTIEHLMAALAGIGVDNLYIEVDNAEMPGLDGSSASFIEMLNKAGIKEQDKDRGSYAVRDPLYVEEEGSSIVALPAAEFKISYTLSYSHHLLKADFKELVLNEETFKSELAGARTFCLEEEALELQRQGLGQGANYQNTLVVGKSGVINNKLRYEDEFIRHKILDLIGDLYLLGEPIKAHIIAIKSGHSLNIKLLKKISQQRQRHDAAAIAITYHPQEGEQLDINGIMNVLPHREPFLFVDRIISLERGKRAVGIKNVTINDYFFKGHFPGKPVMPGVIIVEAMAQVGGVMMLASDENRGKLAYFMAADNLKFRKTVVPGDQLVLEVEAGKIRARTGQVRGRALVDGKIVAEADLMFALAER
ncbi:MAG: UDP-3-O-acyl-N-acetylglucosamine deacetylase [Candidatus Omnitrophica bacterium]|nr:UDP-3-O-acyl-N-acetylglucosamine deacetylase [Candidatus Omnitrophota bacterium]